MAYIFPEPPSELVGHRVLWVILPGRLHGRLAAYLTCRPLRVQVPNILVLGVWVIVIIVQVLGKYMIIRYLDP